MRRFGVDEAGRGPVLGSLFVAAVLGEPEALPSGIDDSKRLSSTRRESLAAALERENAIETATVEITVEEIDAPGTDLNTLTVEAMARAIDSVAGPDAIGLVDACGTDATRFGTRVSDASGTPVRIEAAHGADAEDELVGAASVLAKVTRDEHVETLAEEYGAIGSGYPGDPRTREFLAEYVADVGDLPEIARSSWQTSTDVLSAAEQSRLDAF